MALADQVEEAQVVQGARAAEVPEVLVAEVEEVAEVGLEIRSGSAYITLPTILENKLLAITE